MDKLTTKGKIVFSILGILIITLIAITSIFIFSSKDDKLKDNNNQTTNIKYNEKAIKIMEEKNLYNEIIKNEYSKTIEVMLENNNFEEKYINNYYKINYIDIPNFTTNTNKLLDKDYNSEEINYINNNLKNDISIILNMEHIDILKFKNITNFEIDKLDRYLNYSEKNSKYDMKTVVTYVNIGLDLEGYSKYESYTNEQAENDLTILVNKYHKLPEDYEPSDLVNIENTNYRLRKPAAEALKELTNAAKNDNVVFYPFSAYRSYQTQNGLYINYKNRDGEKEADTYSARPGFSEHQLGLAVDVRSSSLPSNLTNEDYKWMMDNSYKYGFIIRYPKGKQHITQFIEEPWHIRYLGVELATKVHDSGLTYDEYYDLYMKQR